MASEDNAPEMTGWRGAGREERRERRRVTDDDYLTRREAEVILRTAEIYNSTVREAHDKEHLAEHEAVERALDVANRERINHQDAHDREHALHEEKHKSETAAVLTALDAVGRERRIHEEAHDREHKAHLEVHELAQIAVSKAETSVEDRLKAMNEFRAQLRDQQSTFAPREVVDALVKELDRRFADLNAAMQTHFEAAEKLTQDRFETNRSRIDALEKVDVKQEGRGIGQGVVIAAIVTTISIAGGLLGITVLLANFVTR